MQTYECFAKIKIQQNIKRQSVLHSHLVLDALKQRNKDTSCLSGHFKVIIEWLAH